MMMTSADGSVFHREKISRSRSSNAQGYTHPHLMPMSKQFVLTPSWGCMAILRVVARSVMLLFFLAALPFFYESDYNSQITGNVLFNASNEALVQKQWPSHTAAKQMSMVFQDLISEGLLKTGDRALCIGTISKEDINGYAQVGFDMIVEEDIRKQGFPSGSFDFELSVTDSFLADEVDRTLKVGGVAALHLSLAEENDAALNLMDTLVQDLPNYKIVYLRRFDAFGFDTLIAFRKVHEAVRNHIEMVIQKPQKCPMNDKKRAAMKKLEQILLEQPRASWIRSHENLTNIVQFLPNILGYPQKSTGYLYIDVGTNSYKSSIGSWFNSYYPKHNHKFDMFAIQVDSPFGTNYLDHPDGQVKQRGVRGSDLADLLIKTVTEEDYVVMKMDVHGAEFQLLSKMLRSGAICLVDELFLKCHYQTPHKKHQRSYWECLALFGMLRESGVVVHQWWG